MKLSEHLVSLLAVASRVIPITECAHPREGRPVRHWVSLEDWNDQQSVLEV